VTAAGREPPPRGEPDDEEGDGDDPRPQRTTDAQLSALAIHRVIITGSGRCRGAMSPDRSNAAGSSSAPLYRTIASTLESHRRRESPVRTGCTASVITVKFLAKVVILAVTFYVLTYFDVIPGINVIPNPRGPLGEYGTYLWIGLLFGVVNAVVGPVLRLLSLPFVVLTLGLFLLVVNAALLGLTALLTDRMTVDGFIPAVLGGLVLAVVGWAADRVLDR
jgi:putative membrane protein